MSTDESQIYVALAALENARVRLGIVSCDLIPLTPPSRTGPRPASELAAVEEATRDLAALYTVLTWAIERLTANDESRQRFVAAVAGLGYEPVTRLDFGELYAELLDRATSRAWTPTTCATVLVALEAIAAQRNDGIDVPTPSSAIARPLHRTPSRRVKPRRLRQATER